MFVFMTFIYPMFDEDPITWKKILISILGWTLAGLSFGYTMKKFFGRQFKERERNFK
jgi:hypothetical protein